ncbi:MAG: hypothetical protein GVY18_15675, partial [Bacteroidetes bacterium]|nr:hypothetical protein [Bacteroidota bacterium]
MRSHQAITSFLGGELSPRLRGRTDSERYREACEELTNFFVLPQGGIFRRPGAERVATLPSRSRIIPFDTEDDDYAVVVSDVHVKVFQGGVEVYSTASPYSVDDLAEVHYAQDEETLELVCDRVRPQVLTLGADGAWSFGDKAFEAIPQAQGQTAA